MIYRNPDGSWWVQLTVERTGQVFAWSGYPHKAEAQAVEQRLRVVLAREAGDGEQQIALDATARQLPLGVGE